jgi:3-hydroxyethyl bacteriochlorophyllide a dehydrogenase
MDTRAVLLHGPGRLSLETLGVTDPGADDVVVEIRHSGISTGTEKLLWSGRMPMFPGMGYPLVPGYESAGEVVAAGPESGRRTGEFVFVPGADCYGAIGGHRVRGLFGGAAGRLVTKGRRVLPVDPALGESSVLLALAATARHAVAGLRAELPDLIVGHGVLGRLLARLALIAGGSPPTVWDVAPERMSGAEGYAVCRPEDDPRHDYRAVYDVSGDAAGLDRLVQRLAPGGEIVLAGFYPDPVSFAFPPAFMKEARFRIAAEWKPDDLEATRLLVEEGALSLAGLITHRRPAAEAAEAYETAFGDPACLKMILDWRGTA